LSEHALNLLPGAVGFFDYALVKKGQSDRRDVASYGEGQLSLRSAPSAVATRQIFLPWEKSQKYSLRLFPLLL
jgi:hypothetical protein